MATMGNGLWKRAVRVPMCLLRETNARIRKILHRPRTKKSETERTVNELDESVARPHSRHESEIEVIREEEDELLEKAIMDDATINALIDEQKYTSEQIRYLKEDNESTHKELTRATDAVIELRECNKKLLNDLHQLERKCLEQEVQLNDLRVAATSTFAGKTAAAKSIKVAVATVVRPSTAARPFTDVRPFIKVRPSTAAAAFPAVNRTAPLQSISKNRAIDRSRKNPECVSNTQTARKTETQKPAVAAKKVVSRKDEKRENAEKRDRNVLKPKNYDPYRTRQQNMAGYIKEVAWKL